MYLLIGLLHAVFPVIGYFFAGEKGLGYGFIIGVIFAVCTGTFYFVGADIVGLVIGVFVAASMMGKETRDISPFRAILSNLKNRPKRPVVPKQNPEPEEKEEKITGFFGFLILAYKTIIYTIGTIFGSLIFVSILNAFGIISRDTADNFLEIWTKTIAFFIGWMFE